MPLVTEISNDSCSSMQVSKELPITVARKSEKLEIQSEGINLCFVEKHGTETDNEGFVSDTLSSNDDVHVFGKESSQHQLHVPVIQEIDLQEGADLHKNLLACNSSHNSVETDLVNADGCGNFETSDNCFICKFLQVLHCYCTFAYVPADATATYCLLL